MMVEKVTLGVFFGVCSHGSTPGFPGCVSHVWHSPGPAWAARAGEEDDGGCSHSHPVGPLLTHIQKSGRSLLAGTFTQAGFSTPTGDSVAFPTAGGFTGSWSRPEILWLFVLRKLRGLTRGFHKALECVCISTSAWTMHWNYCIE